MSGDNSDAATDARIRLAVTIACPVCPAVVGQECRVVMSKPGGYHHERILSAQAEPGRAVALALGVWAR